MGSGLVYNTLTPRDDAHDFETITGLDLTLLEFGRSDRLAVMFDDYTSR
jgi:hypothetical protein